jgi:flavin-dependent dehydrogenase
VDLDAAGRGTWDAVVVGAGPAGGLAAREMARRGAAVLLVDQAAFPRGKVCGCCLNQRSLDTLASVGLASLIERVGAVPLGSLRLAARGCQASVALPGGVSLSRERFDAALIDAAVGAGAAFLPGTAARLGPLVGDGRAVSLRAGGRQTDVRARLVLAADGLGGTLLGRGGERPDVWRGSRVGSGAVAAEGPAFYGPGVVHMACGRAGYLGLVRLEDGRLDLAAAFAPSSLREAGGPARAAARLLEEVGWPAVPGIEALAWRGTPRLTRRPRRVAGPRLFLLGDAAGYVEPFTGEGMAWALASAAAVAPLAVAASRAWSPGAEGRWEQTHRAVVRRRQLACRAAALVLRRPWLTRACIALLARAPALAGPFVRRLNAAGPAPG